MRVCVHADRFIVLIDCSLVQTAPSQVSEVIKEKVQQRSVQLSWQEPHHPNGVITEYEIKYYEKVSLCACVACPFAPPQLFHPPASPLTFS